LNPDDLYPAPAVSIEENLASEFVRHIVEEIREYSATLDEAHEAGVRLVNFGQTVTFHLEKINYANPSLVYFSGTTMDTGDPVELIQHISQISILLMKIPRLHPGKPIGFLAPRDTEKDG
jgi:hypothetical protein